MSAKRRFSFRAGWVGIDRYYSASLSFDTRSFVISRGAYLIYTPFVYGGVLRSVCYSKLFVGIENMTAQFFVRYKKVVRVTCVEKRECIKYLKRNLMREKINMSESRSVCSRFGDSSKVIYCFYERKCIRSWEKNPVVS